MYKKVVLRIAEQSDLPAVSRQRDQGRLVVNVKENSKWRTRTK